MQKKIISDVVFNIVASIVPVIVLQIVIYPIIALKLGTDQYGLFLTLSSLITVSAASCGNVINNIRLLMDQDYKKEKICGDFNLLICLFSIINMLVLTIGTLYYDNHSVKSNICFILILGFLTLLKEYYIVEFRLNLNFKMILINNILMSFGYLTGTVFFAFFQYWQLIYILGVGFSLIHILANTELYKEPFIKTKFFSKVSKDSLILLTAGILNSLTAYVDRLLLYPLMGGSSVAIYYAASIFGKIISLGMSPISGVMLSYLSKMEQFKRKHFKLLLVVTSGAGLVGYFVCMLISKPMLIYLYPQFRDDSLRYIPLTTAVAMVNMLYSFLNPVILKFRKISWQILVNGLSLLFYWIMAVIFTKDYGLIGFCVSTLIVSILKVLLLITAYYLREKENIYGHK